MPKGERESDSETDDAKRSSLAPHRIEVEVAVLGGGFAGVYCGRRLGKRLGSKGREVALVSDQNYMVFQPMLAEVAGGSLTPRHVINPIRLLCRKIRVFKGEVRDIDLEKREIKVHTGSFSSGAVLHYQQLVLGMGAEIDLSRVPGMPEHAMLMQNVGDAMVLRSTIISRIEEANVENRPEVRRRLLTFVVVGGGYSGVETAGEVLDLLHGIAKYYPSIDPKLYRVVLVHSRDRILQTLSSDLGVYAGRKLRERGLELLLEDRVRAVTATRVYLNSGDAIDTATVVSTVGTAPNRVIRGICDRYEIKHERYRIITRPDLSVPGFEGLWAAGDCAAVPLAEAEEGSYCPQTAQFAMRQGEVLADNVVKRGKEQATETFKFTGLGELASIGHRTAVANVMGMKFSGFIAWFLWRSVYLSKLPGLDRKLRVMVEWTMDLFFPRDINLLNPRYTRLFREVHLEPGDRLFNRGEPAFSLYVVKSGKIELRDTDGAVVRSIEAGDFFGERALVHGGGYIYDAVAPETAELISLSGEVILPFFRASRRLRRVLAKTTAQGSAEAELASVREGFAKEMLSRPVSDVMRGDVATLRQDQKIGDALDLFRHRRHSIYPLVNEDGKLVGVLNREDLFDFLKRGGVSRDSSLAAVDRMHLPSCRAGDTVELALEAMLRVGRYKCLVCDEEECLVGIITVMDLIGEQVEELPAEAQAEV